MIIKPGHAFIIVCLAAMATACRQPFPKVREGEGSEIQSTPIPFTAEHKAAEPFLHTDPKGDVWMSWQETHGGSAYLRYARLEESGWSAARTVDSGRNWFVNWADHPQIASDGHGGFVANTLVRSGPGKYAYDIHLYGSRNGRNWTGPHLAHNDGKHVEHGFVSFARWKDRFLVVWLDGRHTAVQSESVSHHGHKGSMSLRAAWIGPDGRTSLPGWEIDDRTCDCCQTALAVTSSGPVVAYRDRSGDEVRDISVSRFDGTSWTKPSSVHTDGWRIDGCPVNGPRMDAMGDGLAIAWFTGAGNRPSVKVAFSDDGGRSFREPLKIDEGEPIGRVDLCMADDSTAWVSWMERDLLKVSFVSGHGRGTPVSVARTSTARSSGFPQMTRQGRRLVFAWTDSSGSAVRTAFLDTVSIPRDDRNGG